MRRRQALQAGFATAVSVCSSPLIASATDSATDHAATRAAPFEPLGQVRVSYAGEAVVTGDGRTAAVANGDGFVTVDLADPTDPRVLAEVSDVGPDGAVATLEGVQDVVADGDRIALAGQANYSERGLDGFAVFDVSDPADPVRVGPFVETEYANHNVGFEDGHLYRNSSNGIEVWDVTGERHEVVGTWGLSQVGDGWGEVAGAVNTGLHDLTVEHGRAYLAHWNAGAVVLDVSDPTDPTFVVRVGDHDLAELREIVTGTGRVEAYTETPGNAHYVAATDDGGVVAVGAEAWENTPDDGERDAPGGIDLWDISDPAAPERLAFIEPPPTPDASRDGVWTTAHNFEFDDGRLYSAWYQGGVKIHDVSDPSNPEPLAWWRRPAEASFWTARVATPGETFVASNHDRGRHSVGTPGLYVFPDRAGTQANPPDLLRDGGTTTPTATATATPTPTETTTATTTATATPTPTAGGSPSPSGDDGGGGDDDGASDGGGLPGFGLLAGAAGVGLGVARAVARRGDDE